MTLNGSIAGLGPIQSNHLKGKIGNRINRIEVDIQKSQADLNKQNTSSLVDEIQKIFDLHSKEVLSKNEFESAKA